mgnify:CR=1 FL=1
MAETTYPLPSSHPEQEAASRIAFRWLLHLRWGAVACQAILILAVHLLFAITLPFGILALIIAFEALSNLVFGYLKKWTVIPAWLIILVMFLDITLLTALLASTGGPMNPFTFLYLLHIVLGAILLPPRWTWALTLYTIACYAGFFFVPGSRFFPTGAGLLNQQAACHSPSPSGASFEPSHLIIHLQGMWVAFAITAMFIVFFVVKIQKALERHQETLANLQEERVKSEKLAALATLSAGAAHELSTPLATIAVASGEMLHFLRSHEANPDLLEDAGLIRTQVEKCKEILHQMAMDAGEPLGEVDEEYAVQELLDLTTKLFPPQVKERICIHNESRNLNVKVPPNTFCRTLKGLIKNGLDATEPASPVSLTCWHDDEFLFFRVTDRGKGMEPETLAKATEPFFTSKEPGKGMGLGLFLARSVAERYGGKLHLESEPAAGTQVTLSLSLNRVAERREKGY